MAKRLRNLALLGGLGAAAMMMGRKKDGAKDDVDTTADASAGQAKDRLGAAGLDRGDKDTTGDMSAGQAKDRLKDLEKVAPKKPRKAADDKPAARAPTRDEGRTASGLPREARGVAGSGDTGTETEAQYRARMEQLQKDQALGAVRPEEYLGPVKALRGLHNLAKMVTKGRGATEGATTGREVAETAAQARFLGRGPRQEMPARLSNQPPRLGMKKGGVVKSSASKRADGCAIRGKTRGRMV
jgi:hypothetical protein